MYIQGYQVIQTIGRGSFATTYLAMKNSMYYAFKLIRSNLLEKTSHFTQRIEREISNLKSLDNDERNVQHNDIIACLDSFAN